MLSEMMAKSNLSLTAAAWVIDCEVAAITAFADVESGPYGAWTTVDNARVPVILFERHIFSRLTDGKYDDDYPAISNPQAGGYGLIRAQHNRLQQAAKLDRDAALQSASWGRWQIMGFNWQRCGYDSLQQFVNAMYSSEDDHLRAFVRYVLADTKLVNAIRTRDWHTAARLYNGPAYARHKYHTRLAAAYARHAG